MLAVGLTTTIRPAYNSETGERDIYDEIAECECVVLEILRGGYVRVQIRNGEEAEVHADRLRPVRVE